MNKTQHIAINGLFLRKSGTGIGQVTKYFLEELAKKPGEGTPYTVYVDDQESVCALGTTGKIVYLQPWRKRDDLIRKMLWEHIQLPKKALADEVTHFLSLYQAPTEFPKFVQHTMLVHDVIPEIFPQYLGRMRNRFMWNLTKRAARAATHLVAVSNSTKRDIEKYFGIEAEKISVAYPSINPIFFEEGNKEQDQKILEKYTLTPGYLYHGGGLEIRKNTQSLLYAYAAWYESVSEKSTVPPLVISGTVHSANNPLATDVRGLVEALHLEEQVKILGFVPDGYLPALYRGAALFIFPTLYEGFGMPVVEALSQGTAVMALQNSSLLEVGGNAVYFTNEINKDSLIQQYQLAQGATVEERGVRIMQAKNFSSWELFTEKISNILVQY